MISPYQFWIDLWQLLLSPKSLAFGAAELLLSWLYTRRWGYWLLTAPVLAAVLYFAGCSIYLRWFGNNLILKQYWVAIEKESISKSALLKSEKQSAEADESNNADGPDSVNAEADTISNALMSKEELTPLASMLLLKVMQLDASNTRATYLIGTAFAAQGRMAQARQLMRRIAPVAEKGFAPAYAWLAADRLQSLGVRDRETLITLIEDLAQARQWPGVSPALMNAYADILTREKQVDQAMVVLSEAGRRDSRLKVKQAALAKQLGNEVVFEAVKSEILTPRMERISTGKATELDFVEVVSLKLLAEELTEAGTLSQDGLKLYPASLQIRRLLSNSYMMAYEQAVKNEATSQVRMEFLDRAMKVDPGNPVVMEKVATIIMEQEKFDDSNDSLSSYLREQLADGKATAVTHLLVAIGHLKKSELDKALVHLEIAQGLAPNNPIILNNLALCIARERPDELPKARRMMEYALSISRPDAEMYDTYGEILVMCKDYVVAIRAFEAALQINNDRPGTRKKLAEVYTKVALTDMAEAVENKAAGTTPETTPPTTPATTSTTLPPGLRKDGILKSDDILSPVEPVAPTEPIKTPPPENK